MSEIEANVSAASTPSNVIEPNEGSTSLGGGIPKTIPGEEQAKEATKSLRDTLKSELENIKGTEKEAKKENVASEDNEVDDEAKKEEKPAKKPTEKAKEKAEIEEDEKKLESRPEKAEKAQQEPDRRRSEVRRPEAPARFLPQAKEKWYNTPREVQSEVDRIVREYEEERKTYAEDREFRESLRDFDELAKRHGTNIRQALENYTNMERTFIEDPPTAFKALLTNLRMQPQQAIASILQAYGATPQQLAQHMSSNPGAYAYQHRQPVAPQQVQPQIDPTVDYLKKELEELKAQMVTDNIIVPFAESHPRYYELEGDIAFFLQSGKIPTSLSPSERLAAAYDMAERINPPSRSYDQDEDELETKNASRVDNVADFNGKKSVKSSVGAVSGDAEPQRNLSTRELLERELKKLKRA